MQDESLIDRLIQAKTSRPAGEVFPSVSQWFKQTFGSDIPVKNLGASDFERKAGWEHSRSFDVGLHPNSTQGKQLISFLQQQGIPYAAFTGAVSKGGVTVATGPHIHVGPPSRHIEDIPVYKGGAEYVTPNYDPNQKPEFQQASDSTESLVDRLLKQKESSPTRSYDTQLTPEEEKRFQVWKAIYAPNDSGADYDLRGAFKSGVKPAANGHWPDTFKKPNHPTFSIESQYAVGEDRARAGRWAGPNHDIFVPPQSSTPTTAADRRGSYGSRAFRATHPEQDQQRTAQLTKLAHDIDWHFGYSVLMAMPTLPPEKQQQIAQLATQYAAEDEAKKKSGQLITRSLKWQQLNQNRVGVREGIDIEARTPPDVDAAQKAAFRAGANPLLRLPDSVSTAMRILVPASNVTPRMAAESLISGAGGLMEAGAGLLKAAEAPATAFNRVLGTAPADLGGEFLARHAKQAREMAAESQTVSGRGKAARVAQGVGTGLVEFAPLAALPELGLESVMARIGAAAATGGVYSGTQAVGRGESKTGVAKEAAVGGATFGLMGIPLPGKSTLAKALSNLVITGGGATLINKATGASWEDSATQGLVLTLLRSPELVGRIKVRDENGTERPATPADIKGLLPPAKFEMLTNTPVPEAKTSGKQYYRTEQAILTNAQPAQVEGFTTSQGSVYIVSGESTQRTKAPHIGHDPTDVGLKPASEKTVYLDENSARQVGMWNTLNASGKRIVIKNNEVWLTSINPKTNQQGLDGKFSFTTEPKIGKSPLELRERSTSLRKQGMEGYKWNHPGTPIVDVQRLSSTKLTEAGLSQQPPGVIRMSEATARENLKTLQDIKASDTWKKLKAPQKAAIEAQIARLEEQGAGNLPEVPKPTPEGKGVPRWSTREQLKATPEQLRLMRREQAAARGTGTRETSATESKDTRINRVVQEFMDSESGGFNLDRVRQLFQRKQAEPIPTDIIAAGKRYSELSFELMKINSEGLSDANRARHKAAFQELRAVGQTIRDRGYVVNPLGEIAKPGEPFPSTLKNQSPVEKIKRFLRGEGGELDIDELRWLLTRGKDVQDLGSVENPRTQESSAVGAANRYVDDLRAEHEHFDQLVRELKQEKASDVIDLTGQDVDVRQKLKDFLTSEEGSLDLNKLRERAHKLLEENPNLTDEELKLRLRNSAPKAAGQEGSATLDLISGGLVKKLNTARQTVTTLAQTKGVRDAMAYTRDAADTKATNFGEEMRNDVEGPLRDVLGVEDFSYKAKKSLNRSAQKALPVIAADALSFVVEARGNQTELANMRSKIASSTKAYPGWSKRALAAIDFANANFAKLLPIAEKYKQITEAQRVNENTAGLDVLHREGYVMHAQDIEGPTTGLLSPSAGAGETTAFKKVRTYETFADSIANGVNPKTLNALDLLAARVSRGQRLINRRQWVTDLRSTLDTKSGEPIAQDPKIVKRADGTTYPEPPPGYTIEYNGFQPVAIKNGYEGIYSALTDPSWFSKNAATRGFMQANAVGKSISLMMDTFHFGRLAFWESLIKSLGVTTFKAPFPSYQKGVTLLDSTVPEIQRMIAKGEVPKTWGADLLENKRKIDLLVQHGYNVGGVSDALYQDLVHSLPVIGPFNKWLFSKFQRGAMTEVGLLEFERRRLGRPGESEATSARAVAKDLNTRFGNLGRQGIFKSRTGQDIARALALAPQWNEGLIRSELGAVKQAGELVRDVAQGKKIYSGVLLRSVGAMAVGQFVANQVINLIIRGYPTWQNPEEDFGAKLSAWIPDKLGNGPGFFLHPLGLAAETTHLLMKGYEHTDDFRESLKDYLKSRASSAMRPVLTFMLGEDFLGRKLKPGTVWSEVVKSAIPVPIPGRAIYQASKEILTGKSEEEFPGQYQKQIMSSFGMRVEGAPGVEKRMRDLASKFNKQHGVEKVADFPESPYQGLTRHPSLEALQQVIEEKTKSDFVTEQEAKEQIRKYYEQRANQPFTGSAEREIAFKKTLTPEQKQNYDEIRKQRVQERNEIQKLLRQL